MAKHFDDFLDFVIALIAELCDDPAISVDSHFSCYDAARHRMRVVVTTSDGQLFTAEFAPECARDLPGQDPTPYAAAIKYHLAQQIGVATALAERFHALAGNEDERARVGGRRPKLVWSR
jgi:hypothetical protein